MVCPATTPQPPLSAPWPVKVCTLTCPSPARQSTRKTRTNSPCWGRSTRDTKTSGLPTSSTAQAQGERTTSVSYSSNILYLSSLSLRNEKNLDLQVVHIYFDTATFDKVSMLDILISHPPSTRLRGTWRSLWRASWVWSAAPWGSSQDSPSSVELRLSTTLSSTSWPDSNSESIEKTRKVQFKRLY